MLWFFYTLKSIIIVVIYLYKLKWLMYVWIFIFIFKKNNTQSCFLLMSFQKVDLNWLYTINSSYIFFKKNNNPISHSKLQLGYVWFPENLRENARERKYKRKVEGKKKWRKIKNRLKVDKLFFLLLQTHFIYFNSSI